MVTYGSYLSRKRILGEWYTLGRFSAIPDMGDNFSDYFFVFLYTNALMKKEPVRKDYFLSEQAPF